ncbi:MAG: hypothetical protein IPJ71_06830 [Bdellovibrionales bacterium]|nr:hypothetical protein [Bdellovibrionales bacterium]
MSSKRRAFSQEYKTEAVDLAEKIGTTKRDCIHRLAIRVLWSMNQH